MKCLRFSRWAEPTSRARSSSLPSPDRTTERPSERRVRNDVLTTRRVDISTAVIFKPLKNGSRENKEDIGGERRVSHCPVVCLSGQVFETAQTKKEHFRNFSSAEATIAVCYQIIILLVTNELLLLLLLLLLLCVIKSEHEQSSKLIT